MRRLRHSRQVANDLVVQFIDVIAGRAKTSQMLDLLCQHAILDLEVFCRRGVHRGVLGIMMRAGLDAPRRVELFTTIFDQVFPMLEK